MKFLREIPMEKILQKDLGIFEQNGLTLVWKENSLEIWAEC